MAPHTVGSPWLRSQARNPRPSLQHFCFQCFQNKQAMLLSMSYLNKGYNHPATRVVRWSRLFAVSRNFFCLQSLPPFTLIITVSPLAVDNINWTSKFYTVLKGARFVVILSSSGTRLHSLEPATEKALSVDLTSLIFKVDSFIVPVKRSCQGNLSQQLEKSNFLDSLSQFHGGLWKLWGKNMNFTQYSSSNKGGVQEWSVVPETKCHQSLTAYNYERMVSLVTYWLLL